MAEKKTTFSWRIAALGTFAIVLSYLVSSDSTSPSAVLTASAAVLLIALSPLFPITSGAVYIALSVLVAAVEGLRSAIFILSAALLVALIARSGHWRYAAGVGAVIAHLATTSVFTGIFLPYDPAGSLILVALLIAGLWSGSVMRSSNLRHDFERRRLAQVIENHREHLMFTLHDSVATTLTSVVMRAETLGLELEGKPRQDAKLIAEETRQAMQEVRHLIQIMRDGDDSNFPPITRSIGEQVHITSRLLQSHGFRVEADLDPVLQTMAFPAGIERVFAELATNAVKYAIPSSTVGLSITTVDKACKVIMHNSTAEGKHPGHLSSGVGLSESRKILKHVGARLETKRVADQWKAEFVLPLTALHQ